MDKQKLFSFFAVILVIIFALSIFTFAEGVIFEYGSSEEVRAELLKAMDGKDFAKSDDKVRAQSFIRNMDLKKLSDENQEFVDKYMEKVMGQKELEKYDKEIANKYFGSLSDSKFSIETGSELKYDGEKLVTKSGASIDPEKIPDGVKSIKEKDGKLVFEYSVANEEELKPSEKKEGKTAKVSLEKGSFDKDMNPSNGAVFSVEGNDANLGGVDYHPDGGKVERLGENSYKITDNNLQDHDFAGVILNDPAGSKKSVRFSVTGGESYVGTDKALYDKTKNGLLMEGNEYYAKGDFELDLFEPEKDQSLAEYNQPFAEYKFKKGLLDESGRKVIDGQTDSEIGIHYQKDGKEVVWDVDGDDFDKAPEGTLNAGKKQEVRKQNEEIGDIFEEPQQQGVPPKKVNQPIKSDEEEEKKPDESKIETQPPRIIVQPTPKPQVTSKISSSELQAARKGGLGQIDFEQLPIRTQNKILNDAYIKRDFSYISSSNLDVNVPLKIAFFNQYGEKNFKAWAWNNIGITNQYKTYVYDNGDSIIVYSPDAAVSKRAFVADAKYKPLFDKIFDSK